MTILESIIGSLRRASDYNSADQAAPVCILWTDEARQWDRLIQRLRGDGLPILILGDYDPCAKSGPAIWLRCMIAQTLPEADWPVDQTPIIYLPGVSRPMLRAVETCPAELQPIAELQYRGVFWSHPNGKDWTVSSYLQSDRGGLDLSLDLNDETREAISRSLTVLADESVESMRAEPVLTADYFNRLLNPDPVRNLLVWLNDPEGRRVAMPAPEWDAFCDTCRHDFSISLDEDGPITAARRLGSQEGPWKTVWNRLADAPKKYPNIPNYLRQARPEPEGLFTVAESWPQDNEEAEDQLRSALLDLEKLSPEVARSTTVKLNTQHGGRRRWIWAELGLAPLACALEHLVAVASFTANPIGGADADGVAQSYVEGGWRADAAVLDALSISERTEDIGAVKTAIGAMYRTWLDAGADGFQKRVAAKPVPPQPGLYAGETPEPGRCILFADGLRFDVAKKLSASLSVHGLSVGETWRFAALPTVTPTAKPAISPASPLLAPGPGFDTVEESSGTRTTIDTLRRALGSLGYQILQGHETGDPTGSAWTEYGNLDSFGHAQGWLIARRISEEIGSIGERIRALLNAGWKEVVVITDHGWLLLPGGLPKNELPEHLTESRKGRCARMKSGQAAPYQTVPWHWDATVSIAIAPGISCYVAGKEYEHGGLSVQECVVPILTVQEKVVRARPTIGEIRWPGHSLRCRISVANAPAGSAIDIRLKPGDMDTSVLSSRQSIMDGHASALVEDDSLQGQAAVVVVLGPHGDLLAQHSTIVGGD